MVHTQPYGRSVGTAQFQKRYERLTYAIYFLFIFIVRKLQFFECAGGVNEIPRIYTYLLDMRGCFERRFRVEMHVGYQGNVSVKPLFYFRHIGGFADSLGGKPHYVGAGLGDGIDLLHTSRGVVGICVGH